MLAKATVLLAALVASAGASTALANTLVCKGGGGTLGLIAEQGQAPAVRFYYAKGTQAAVNGLANGACSWVDRGMSQSDAPCLEQRGTLGAFWIFPGRTESSYPNMTNAAWVRNFLQGNSVQSFQVQVSGNGCYVVTRLGG